uniref:hypothetical protein n=1 Tax=Amycolatopsis sp. CA-096443 TaxID=3239919 RepID=UPI003F49A959
MTRPEETLAGLGDAQLSALAMLRLSIEFDLGTPGGCAEVVDYIDEVHERLPPGGAQQLTGSLVAVALTLLEQLATTSGADPQSLIDQLTLGCHPDLAEFDGPGSTAATSR